jgi:hypothetical protein
MAAVVHIESKYSNDTRMHRVECDIEQLKLAQHLRR